MEKIDGFINTFKTAINSIWPMLTLLLVIYVLIRITYLLINREKLYLYKEIYQLLAHISICTIWNIFKLYD